MRATDHIGSGTPAAGAFLVSFESLNYELVAVIVAGDHSSSCADGVVADYCSFTPACLLLDKN